MGAIVSKFSLQNFGSVASAVTFFNFAMLCYSVKELVPFGNCPLMKTEAVATVHFLLCTEFACVFDAIAFDSLTSKYWRAVHDLKILSTKF